MAQGTDRKKVMVAALTPRRGDALDRERFGRLVARFAGAGLDGILVGGSTGRGDELAAAELALLLEDARRGMPEAELLAGFGARPIARDDLLARDEFLAGRADLLLVPPPEDDREILPFFAAIAGRTRAPVLVYQPPGRCARPFPTSLARELAGLPGLAGVKDSSGAEDLLECWRGGRPGFRLLLGSIRLFARRARDVDGAILAFANHRPDFALALARGESEIAPAIEAELQAVAEGGLAALERLVG